MKYQVLVCLKNNIKKYSRLSSAAVVVCALRINPIALRKAKIVSECSRVNNEYRKGHG